MYIHIGFGRTATTWLQELIFSQHDKIHYLGKTENNYPQWLIELHYLDDYYFQKNEKKIKDKINELKDPAKINVISSEAFTRSGGEIFNQARRIKIIFSNVKIILVLRDPIDLIASFYKYTVGEGLFTLDLEEYLDWGLTPFVHYKRKPIYLPDFFYDNTINIYQSFLGADTICILKYEDLKNNRDHFFSRLGDFMNVEFDPEYIKNKTEIHLNTSLPEEQITLTRSKNLLCFMEKYFPAIVSKISLDEAAIGMHSGIITPELGERLKEYFKGKCYGYY